MRTAVYRVYMSLRVIAFYNSIFLGNYDARGTERWAVGLIPWRCVIRQCGVIGLEETEL